MNGKAPLTLSTPDGTHIVWDANGDRIATFHAHTTPGYWVVTLTSGLEYLVGEKTPEDVAASLLPS